MNPLQAMVKRRTCIIWLPFPDILTRKLSSLKLLLISSSVAILGSVPGHGEWEFPCEAAKGPLTRKIDHPSIHLDEYLTTLPSFQQDPVPARTRIVGVDLTEAGTVDGHRVIEVRMQVSDPVYPHFYSLLIEQKPDSWLPLFFLQYSPAVKRPINPELRGSKVITGVRYSGTSPAERRYTLAVGRKKGQFLMSFTRVPDGKPGP